ncbi:hypothetical protein [Bordetella sp. LUAb4]|uniref:hypothetical protein n=1 Tax=Bordetella sp. LUAb4 TaxID=2843195 RepID=UPI001E58BC92|nr:hypothetical protein [Bordetella sp. LUAb4]
METGMSSLGLADCLWVVINLVLPIVLPAGGLWMMRVSLPKPSDREGRNKALASRRYVLLFKDGQLGWVALLMCFTAISEFSDGLLMHHKSAPWWTIFFFLTVAVTIFVAGVYASYGAVVSVSVKQTGSLREWIDHYGIAFWTTIFAVLAATALTVAHFWATPR